MRVADRYGVLIADEPDCPLGQMALRLTRIGIDPLYTNSVDEALLLAQQEGRRLGAVCFPVSLDPERVDLLTKLVAERVGLAGDAMVPIGERPGDDVVLALRERGIRWALWGEHDDADLRFVLSHVIQRHCPDDLRIEPRVPAGHVEAKLYKGAMARPAKVVDVSVTGAFLETDKPLPEGSAVSLELALPDGVVRMRASICWTRRDEDQEREDLFVGMGVEFVGDDPERQAEVRRFVRAQMARYVVSVGNPKD